MKLIFGVIYIVATVVFALSFYLGLSSPVVNIVLAVYLIGKGVVSAVAKSSLLSALDSVAGFYFLLLALSVFPVNFVTVVFLLYLAQKGIFNVFRGFY